MNQMKASSSPSVLNDDSVSNPVESTATDQLVSSPVKPQVNSSGSSLGDLWTNMDHGMMIRMTYVLVGLTIIIVLYFVIKMWRMKKRAPIRRYDVLSAKQLQPELVVDSESEDELFTNDDHTRLMREQNGH